MINLNNVDISKNPLLISKEDLLSKTTSKKTSAFWYYVYHGDLSYSEYNGKILLFNDNSFDYYDLIYNDILKIAKKYNLSFKVQNEVLCLYVKAYEYDLIIKIMKYLKTKNYKKDIYYKLDIMTIKNIKYNNKNYIYSSNNYNNICKNILLKVSKKFRLPLNNPNL